MSTLKRAAILVLKGSAIIATLVFGFSPVTTNTGILLFGAAMVVTFVCVIALSYLDDDFPKATGNEGYWPKPLDWSTPNNSSNERPTKTE
jgi:hypothetical protein